MSVTYDSNNSGGGWWLDDDDWRALEAAGWIVNWHRNRPEGPFAADKNGRWLGALATSATREGLSLDDAITEWERVMGQDSTDGGCSCCGQPHNFVEYDDAGKFVRFGPDASCDDEDDE